MKKTALILLLAAITVMAVVTAYADPFLVCDPFVGEKPTHFVYSLDGAAEVTVEYAEREINGELVAVVMDMESVADGTHRIEVKAANLWGSSAASPFDFSVVRPSQPINIRFRK